MPRTGQKADRRKILAAAKKIRMLILDVDGVLTDGSIILDNEGNEFKSFHVRDGHGIKMLGRAGIQIALITGRYSRIVDRRAMELGIAEVYQRCHAKAVAYEQLLTKFNLTDDQVAYVGDDIVDIALLKRVGLPIVVADAAPDAKKHALMVTSNRGGRSAVREVTDLLLKAAGKWEELLAEYEK
ncbi:MAG TPA: HAD-IIIA family hydrolase [Dissulfurispiraceae bacterium]|nr:HAD-IIIA family hydrolase [Dissulfurispiraceae bacterium]